LRKVNSLYKEEMQLMLKNAAAVKYNAVKKCNAENDEYYSGNAVDDMNIMWRKLLPYIICQ